MGAAALAYRVSPLLPNRSNPCDCSGRRFAGQWGVLVLLLLLLLLLESMTSKSKRPAN
jgi:hypothetical protein